MIKQIPLFSAILISFTIASLQFSSCKKDTVSTPAPVCDIKGTYSGTSIHPDGSTFPVIYKFEDNNFAIGYETLTGPAVTFGGYRNTCDSVILSVHYDVKDNYYLLQGKFLNNRATISGTYKNLTSPSDFGTFSVSK